MTLTRQQAKSHLKQLGWSQRRAAKQLGVTMEHLNRVLSGVRESRKLLGRIAALPPSPTPYRCTGFAAVKAPDEVRTRSEALLDQISQQLDAIEQALDQRTILRTF